MKAELTHRVAVNAYLIFRNRFLLLKRKTKPLCWAPPGGRLNIDEDPKQGLIREIKEETGIIANIHYPVTTWYGILHGGYLLSVDYLCTCSQNKVILSSEHEDYGWLTISELHKNENKYFSYDQGFQMNDFEYAWKIFELFLV